MVNSDNYYLFNNQEEADNWVWRIENGVGDWVAKHGKSYWYLVQWESKRNGTLKETVTRKGFAKLLVQECSDALNASDNVDAIFHNIEKFSYKQQLKNFDKLPEKSIIRSYVDELSDLLTCDVPQLPANDSFSLEQRMQEYLTMTTANESYKKVLVHPIYEGKRTTMSVESYVSKRFMDEQRPSHTTIFECVDEKVTEERVDMIFGRFGARSNTKLFIASTHAFSGNVKKEAEHHNIGLIMVNPQYQVNEDSFVLPRTFGQQLPEEERWLGMLEGTRKMTEPILVYDNDRIDDSLSFVLYKYASYDVDNLFVSAPFYSEEDIEKIALQQVRPIVELYTSQLEHWGPQDKVPSCVIDPYQLARNMGLQIKRGKTGKKLGQIDISRKVVTLSDRLDFDDPSDRFSMGHEDGHYIIHRRIFEIAKDGVHTIVARNRRWLEHHANYFASCLLMPRKVVRLLYEIYWRKEFGSGVVSPLIIKGEYFRDPVFQRVACPIARKMNVTPQAMYIRLKKVGLLFDEA